MKSLVLLLMMAVSTFGAGGLALADGSLDIPQQGPYSDNSRKTTYQQDPLLWDAIKMPHQCRATAHQISSHLVTYDNEIEAHHDQAARQNLEWIFKTLRAQTDCFESLAVFYSLRYGSYFISEYTGLFIDLYLRGQLKLIRDGDLAGMDAKGGKILGAYDCETTTIYFDPFRGPNDIADILSHERDHLLRDKFISELQGKAPRLTAIEYSIADETIATITGALTELDESNNRHREFDLSLFRDQGALVHSIRHFNHDAKELLVRPSYGMQRYMHFIGTDPRYDKELRQMIAMVASVYAPHSHYREDVLVKWIRAFNFDDLDFWSSDNGMIYSFAYNSKYKTFDNMISHPSKMCREFIRQIEKGDLKDYLGTHVPTPNAKPGSEGTKPGSEGTKPGSEGTKPGSEGTKPGSEGTKPGSEGTKPGAEAMKLSILRLRPCIAPPPGF